MKKPRWMMFGIVVFFCAHLEASGKKILHVPTPEYPTIASAIAQAGQGGRILVGPGRYRENLVINDKSLSIESVAGPEATVLDGGRSGSVVAFKGGPTGNRFVIEGFTITNGSGSLNPINKQTIGGGLHIGNGEAVIQGNIITGNQCISRAGGMAAGMYVSARAVIRDNVISLNEANKGPGGIYLSRCEAEVYNNYILSNKAGNSAGGIWVFTQKRAVRIHDNLFFDNWSSFGGAICVDMCSPVIEGNVFYKSKGCRSGSIFCKNKGADPVIRGNLIQHGWACFGGGILCYNGASPLIVGNVIIGNTTISEYCMLTPIQVRPDLNGGGIYCWNNCSPTIACNIIAGNSSLRYGGGIGCWNSSPFLFGNTIYGNRAIEGAGGLFCNENSKPNIYNTIFWNNEPEEIIGHGELACCDVEGGCIGKSNLDIDPDFLDAGNNDFRLSPSSPLRDAGFCIFDGMPDTDFEGDPRFTGAGVDIGADEFFPFAVMHGTARPGDALEVELVGAPSSVPVLLAMVGLRRRQGPALPVDCLPALPEGMTGDPTKGLPLPVPSRPLTRSSFPFVPWALKAVAVNEEAASMILPADGLLLGGTLEWISLGRDRHGEWKPSGRSLHADIHP